MTKKTITANLIAFPSGLLLKKGEKICIIDNKKFIREKTGEQFEIDDTKIFDYGTE